MPIIVNDNNELVHYIHIPKTGGSSIEKMISNLYAYTFFNVAYQHGRVSPQHFDKHLYEDLNLNLLPSTKFTIVRHPVERIVSEYKYLKKHSRAFRMFVTFDAFVNYAFNTYKANSYVYDNHIKPQSDFILPGTKIFKLEDGLENVMHWLKENANLNQIGGGLVKENSSSKDVIHVTQSTYKKIVSFYHQDFTEFDYSELPSNSYSIIDKKNKKIDIKFYMYRLYLIVKRCSSDNFIS